MRNNNNPNPNQCLVSNGNPCTNHRAQLLCNMMIYLYDQRPAHLECLHQRGNTHTFPLVALYRVRGTPLKQSKNIRDVNSS